MKSIIPTIHNRMEVLEKHGNDGVAWVYVASVGERMIEFVESVQPPIPRDKKWVLIVSTLYGCPVGCAMCDAGGGYEGMLSAEDMLAQIDYMVGLRYPDKRVPAGRFKVQFARMGEPALNTAVLDVLETLPSRYNAPGLLPSISTVAPSSAGEFFRNLKRVKDKHYSNGMFQLQFSLHSTNEEERDRLMPVRKWSLAEIANYGNDFRSDGDRKVTLNFAVSGGASINPQVLGDTFNPENFLIKLTPLNPTIRGLDKGLVSGFDAERPETAAPLVRSLEKEGFETILSIGELEENQIGSNCGQYVRRRREAQ